MSYSRTDYYAEGLAEAFEEHGVAATPEQIRAIADDVAGWTENIGMAFHTPVGDPRDSELGDLRKQLRCERNKIACKACKGSGTLHFSGPYHGSTSSCHKCNGTGRHAP
ncbi:hypothetical protein [Pseudomonas entomophila]|uniref:hypothetical protein n=1 Tax=Pseudomonas entomophila TaxID=312306 RepID=UPI001EFFE980|nr:hypothetical protein [Pseudomonas entomophila]MCG8291926.1 hypothetical protein [Pseudomonas entomophila]